MIWLCWCGKEIKQQITMAKDENGKVYLVDVEPDLTDPQNPCNPDSHYWSAEHDQVYCGPEHMIRAQRVGFDLSKLGEENETNSEKAN